MHIVSPTAQSAAAGSYLVPWRCRLTNLAWKESRPRCSFVSPMVPTYVQVYQNEKKIIARLILHFRLPVSGCAAIQREISSNDSILSGRSSSSRPETADRFADCCVETSHRRGCCEILFCNLCTGGLASSRWKLAIYCNSYLNRS